MKTIIFEVASHRGLKDEYIERKPISWLAEQYALVLNARKRQVNGQTLSTELAFTRAIARLLGHKVPNLESKPSTKKALPAWQMKFEKVNKDRRI